MLKFLLSDKDINYPYFPYLRVNHRNKPMRKILIFATFMLLSTVGRESSAQNRNTTHDVELYSNTRSDHGVEILAKKREAGSYTVVVFFTSLENAQIPGTQKYVIHNEGTLFTLTPLNADKSIRYQYNYRYIRGHEPRKVDSAFVYRLPFSTQKGKTVKVNQLYNINERYFKEKSLRGWKSFQFYLSEGDTVFAARKGIVVQIEDGHEPGEKNRPVSFSSTNNSLIIEHPDGTLATYQVFDKGSFLVSTGETVYPGTPLGKAGTYYKGGEYQIRFMVSYPELSPAINAINPEKNPFTIVYYNPHFLTPEGVVQLKHGKSYKAATSRDLEQKEMTKKELKAAATGSPSRSRR